MKNIIIIGARGTGQSVYKQVYDYIQDYDCYRIKGFLDDDSTVIKNPQDYPPILGSVESYEIQPNDCFLSALGDPFYRKKYVEMILDKGGDFVTFVSKKSYVVDNVKIGKGVLVGPFNFIDANVEVGDHSLILSFCNIGHDSKIGNYCELEPYTAVSGNVVVEDGVTLHARSTIAPKLCVGENSVIGAGSVVLRDVEPNSIMFGSPARKIPVK